MQKNLLGNVADLLGVELGEEFVIQNADRKETVVLGADGLHVVQPNGVLGPEHGKLLSKVLQGLYDVQKKPWDPKNGDRFYAMLFTGDTKPSIDWYIWSGCIEDYAYKKLGMIYRTEAEAKEHFAEDYERLTGKKLEEQENHDDL